MDGGGWQERQQLGEAWQRQHEADARTRDNSAGSIRLRGVLQLRFGHQPGKHLGRRERWDYLRGCADVEPRGIVDEQRGAIKGAGRGGQRRTGIADRWQRTDSRWELYE